jgi:hypothetical protein
MEQYPIGHPHHFTVGDKVAFEDGPRMGELVQFVRYQGLQHVTIMTAAGVFETVGIENLRFVASNRHGSLTFDNLMWLVETRMSRNQSRAITRSVYNDVIEEVETYVFM